MHKSEQNISP